MSYVDPFGVSAVNPSDVSYVSLTLTADVTLDWPNFVTTNQTTARIIEVSADVGLNITLPNATQSSVGTDILFKNTGANTFTVKDNAGNTITTVVAGAAKYTYLTDVSTAAGIWESIAFGVGSTTVDAASLIGYGIKAISSSLNQSHPITLSGISFTIDAADRARLYIDTAGGTINLPAASGIGNDFFFLLRNGSAGNTVVTAAGADLIDNVTSLTLAPEESCLVCCSGTGWYTVGRGRSATFLYTQLTKNVAGSSNVTLTGTEAGYAIIKFIGALTGNINVVVPNITAVWYIDNSTTGTYSLTVKTAAGSGVAVSSNNRVILYGDGTNVLDAQTVFTTSGLFASGSAGVPSISFSTDTDTGFYLASSNNIGVTGNGANLATFTPGGLLLATDLALTEGGTGASTASGARTNLGLGTISTQNSNSVTITGGTITGITDLAVADGGTGASDAATARTNLGLGSAAVLSDTVIVQKTSSTGSAVLPVGTTAQRDGSPAEGYLRYNSSTKGYEGGFGTAWGSIGGGAVGGGVDKVFVGNDTLVTTDYLLGSEAITTPVTATPATNLLNATAHGFIADQLVQFSTTTTLPAPLLVETGYWVISSGLTADTFKVSATMGGTEIDITTTGTGSHLVGKLKNYSSVNPIIATGVTVRVPSNCTWSITG